MTSPLIALPRIPVGDKIDEFVAWLNTNLGWLFDAVRTFLEGAVEGLITLLQAPNPLLMAVIFAVIGLAVKGWQLALGSLLGLLFIISMEQWPAAMQTLALVLVATLVAVVIGIPLGVLAARNRHVSSGVKPILDLMQTMPALVWLLPAVILFGIGQVPGLVGTVIFALPPAVRLTELGIRNVDAEVVEAANAFGSTPRQTLLGVQLPLAMPTIMAGVNQVIMLALSMAVLAGLVGAEGLGGEVTGALQTVQIGRGFEAGLSIVVLAIYLDRVTASLGHGGGVGVRLLRQKKVAPVEQDAVEDETGQEEEPAVPEDFHSKVG